MRELIGAGSPAELGRMRDLQKGLEGAGFEVLSVGFPDDGDGETPAALVRRRAVDLPAAELVACARALLRAAERVALPFRVTGEQAETLAAVRLTLRAAVRLADVRPRATLGDAAHDVAAAAVHGAENAAEEVEAARAAHPAGPPPAHPA